MRALASLVVTLLAACGGARELPEACVTHQTRVCEECGPSSGACESIRASMELGRRRGLATPAQCQDGLEQHARNIEAMGGAEAWCRAANDLGRGGPSR